jgi:hypothetical protein
MDVPEAALEFESVSAGAAVVVGCAVAVAACVGCGVVGVAV